MSRKTYCNPEVLGLYISDTKNDADESAERGDQEHDIESNQSEYDRTRN